MTTHTLVLTARIESKTPSHARIGVFQNHGKAGILVVDADYAEQIVGLLGAAPKLLEAAQALVNEWQHEEDAEFAVQDSADRLRAAISEATD